MPLTKTAERSVGSVYADSKKGKAKVSAKRSPRKAPFLKRWKDHM